MKKITVLHLDSCPYCHNAKRAMEELKATSPEYAQLEVEWIEENRQPDLAESYGKDYYYVPSIFVDGKKVYEAHPGESYEECRDAVAKAFKVFRSPGIVPANCLPGICSGRHRKCIVPSLIPPR